jgi:DNA-binding MarR family transcriptional regulator
MINPSVDNVNHKPGGPEEVFEAIHTIMHLFRSEQYRVVRDGPDDLTHLEGRLLGFFARNPGATLRDLSRHSGRDKGQMARLIKTLKQQGLLTAEATAGDRRSVRLQLTSDGRAVHQALDRRMKRLARVAVQGLSAGDRRQLAGLLHQVRANLEAASTGGGKPGVPPGKT